MSEHEVQQVYERLGRAIMALDGEVRAHLGTIALLHRLKSGEVSLADVQLIGANGWRIGNEGSNGASPMLRRADEVKHDARKK